MFFDYIIIMIVAAIGGWIGNRIRLPAGTIMGSMLAVGTFKYFELSAVVPSTSISFIVQILLGIMLGVSFSSLKYKELKKLAKILLITSFGVVLMVISVPYLIATITTLDLPLLFLSTAPGGLSEMSMLAQSLGWDAPIVAIFHITRLFIVLAIFPFILKVFQKNQMNEL